MDEMHQPPYSNTGAQNTMKNRVILDWCAFTVIDRKFIPNLLNIPWSYFSELPRGGNGYKKQATFSGITVQWDGNSDMGVHIEMSGTGCRTFEGLHGDVWSLFFMELLECDAKFTRIDIALDDFEGLLHMRTLESKIRKAYVRSRWKDARILNKIKLESGIYQGRTIYFGSPQSRILARFYDKALEQKSKGVENVPDHWVRCELQCRDDRALKVAQYISDLSTQFLGDLSAMFVRNYLEFLNPLRGDTNKSRWPVCSWWDSFLVYTGKLKLTTEPKKKGLDDVRQWIVSQVSASLAMLSFNSKGELVSLEDVVSIALDGKDKLKDKHLRIIKEYERKLYLEKKEDPKKDHLE